MTDPTPVPVPLLVSGEELLVAADVIEPVRQQDTDVRQQDSEPSDSRLMAVLTAFDQFDVHALSNATLIGMAGAAIHVIDDLRSKQLHPSNPGWDGFDPGADVEPDDDHTVTDPHATWATYDHPAIDYYGTPGDEAAEDRQRHMSGGNQ